MINFKTRDEIAKTVAEALIGFALGDTGHYGFEVIDGVCSWGVVVAPEFMYSSDDDVRTWVDVAENFYNEADRVRIGDISEYVRFNFFPLHIGFQWEYNGTCYEVMMFGSEYFDPKGMTLEQLVDIAFNDYRTWVKQVEIKQKERKESLYR